MKAEYVDHMGDDLAVVNAARVSFDKESDWIYASCTCAAHNSYECMCGAWEGERDVLPEADQKLISYLAKHKHWTPFAHTAIKLRMKAPVPIRTQCFKHKQGFVENEESRRYISSIPEVYVPSTFRKAPTDGAKQGSEGEMPDQGHWQHLFKQQYRDNIRNYQYAIDKGMCPEQARFLLPQGAQVNWIWTGNVASYARFCSQRTDSHAQAEIRELATAVSEILASLFPVSWEALMKTMAWEK